MTTIGFIVRLDPAQLAAALGSARRYAEMG